MTELEKDCLRAHSNVDRSSGKTVAHALKALDLDDAKKELIAGDVRTIAAEFGSPAK